MRAVGGEGQHQVPQVRAILLKIFGNVTDPSRWRRAYVTALALLAAWISPATPAWAHPLQFTAATTTITARGNDLDFRTSIPFIFTYPPSNKAERIRFVEQYFKPRLIVRQSAAECVLTIKDVAVTEGPAGTEFTGIFQCPEPVESLAELELKSTLWFDVFQNVNHFFKLYRLKPGRLHEDDQSAKLGQTDEESSEERAEALLDKNTTEYAVDAKEGRGLAVMKNFIGFGIEHVLLGFDHLLFVIVIHLFIRRIRDVVAIVTSFTVAHSLTLILSATGHIAMSPSVVEPLIAFSIAYAAFRNLEILASLDERFMHGRWFATFGFGLLHGLGFAGALANINVPDNHMLAALFGFNFGVEIGQLLIVAAIVPPLVFAARRGKEQRVVRLSSLAILLIAAYWTIQRIYLA